MKDKEEKKNEGQAGKEQILSQKVSDDEMATVAAGVGPGYDSCPKLGPRP